MKLKKICVFCSSSNEIDSKYFDSARQFGELLVENGLVLVYGGGKIGLMGEISKTVTELGGKVTGVIPVHLNEKEIANDEIDELIITETMRERKAKMEHLADAFVVLAGGFGTLEEALEIITLKMLDRHQKPIVFLNTKGFFNPLFQQFQVIISEHFARHCTQKMYTICETPTQVMDYLKQV